MVRQPNWGDPPAPLPQVTYAAVMQTVAGAAGALAAAADGAELLGRHDRQSARQAVRLREIIAELETML